MIVTSDGSQISQYIYDANGERAMKYNGTLSKQQINQYTLIDYALMDRYTYYPSPLLVFGSNGYSKHYFIEGQRVMSRIGAGMANNLMDMEDGAYDYIMSALSDSIKSQLAASFECLSLDGIAVFNTSIEPILEMANQNNHEFLRYFYHPDHLGSSSFITGATGEPTQHLEYLPFGELFIEERSTWNTPYKFSAKELDDETGYSYFGARYYDPNISIWLSVDPLAFRYPAQTPYSYVGNRPLNVIDPFGLDEWEVGGNGKVQWVKESKKHTLYRIDSDGNRTGASISMHSRKIFDQLANRKDGNSVAICGKTNQDNMAKAFLFLADNTDVEWRMDRYGRNDGEDGYSLGSNHSLDSDFGGMKESISAEAMGHPGESVIAFVHSHPGRGPDVSDEISSMGWWPHKGVVTGDVALKTNSNLRDSYYYTYFPSSGNLWSVNPNGKAPSFIRNIYRNHTRFFFGTLNSR